VGWIVRYRDFRVGRRQLQSAVVIFHLRPLMSTEKSVAVEGESQCQRSSHYCRTPTFRPRERGWNFESGPNVPRMSIFKPAFADKKFQRALVHVFICMLRPAITHLCLLRLHLNLATASLNLCDCRHAASLRRQRGFINRGLHHGGSLPSASCSPRSFFSD